MYSYSSKLLKTLNNFCIRKARKIAPNKYDIYSEYPRGKYKTVMYASSRFILRRQIEDWLEYLLTKEGLK